MTIYKKSLIDEKLCVTSLALYLNINCATH